MKYLAFCEDVKTPNHILIESADDLALLPGNLNFPLFVKCLRSYGIIELIVLLVPVWG
jgi:hypothetical protein